MELWGILKYYYNVRKKQKTLLEKISFKSDGEI